MRTSCIICNKHAVVGTARTAALVDTRIFHILHNLITSIKNIGKLHSQNSENTWIVFCPISMLRFKFKSFLIDDQFADLIICRRLPKLLWVLLISVFCRWSSLLDRFQQHNHRYQTDGLQDENGFQACSKL